ncbi:prepilin-type N-terminal cleavage/methylation domain-containing protein [Marinicella litoralis]|uniref:Type II secretion system protein J (GspJ) n=1 Tax=Marinicella litoralis TaxID=644220 RepID=A0A4R6XMB8_9GAMM|nr:prepilin-type N-terminal cleavage/methylation domain-containing protein [Marinicella litoralis]TDR20802.1 type II secretion system protein J (GspJ) [Marinicella litoralis]
MRKQQGFTLIEVIVVFTLLAMIMAMIFSGIDSGRRTAEKGEKRITAINEIRVIQNIIRSQVSKAMALGVAESDEGELLKFIGEEQSITFVSQMPGYLGKGGPHIQKLELINGRNGKELLYTHGLISNYDDEDEMSEFDDAEPMVLLENIRNGSFAFIELDEEGLPTDWIAELENPAAMPLMVQLDLEMNRQAKEHWPLLQIALQVDGASSSRRTSTMNLLQNRSNTETKE